MIFPPVTLGVDHIDSQRFDELESAKRECSSLWFAVRLDHCSLHWEENWAKRRRYSAVG